MDEKQLQTTFRQIQCEKNVRLAQLFQLRDHSEVPKTDCSTCSKAVDFSAFKTADDLNEWRISGMCKECQDSVFS
jgi:hypothetical protein